MPRPRGLRRLRGLLLLSVAVSACGGSSSPSSPGAAPTPTPAPTARVFASNSEWIDTFTMGRDGTLSTGPRLMPTRGILPSTIVSGGGRRLYLSNLVGIEGFLIDPTTGGIAPLSGSPFTAERGGLMGDPLDRFVWQRRSGAVQAFRIDAASGRLAASGAASPVSPFFSSSTVETQGRFLYGMDAQNLAAYRVEGDGFLTSLSGSPWPLLLEGVNPTQLHAGAGTASSFLFFSSQGDGVRPSSVLVYRFDPATGVPQPAFVQPVPADRVADALVVSPSGAYLYVCERNMLSTDERPGILVVFAIEAPTGRLTEVNRVTTGRTEFSDIEIAPDGTTLLVTLEPSPFVLPLGPSNLAVFHVEAGATLTPVAGSPYPLGPGPHTLHVLTPPS